MVWFTKIGHLYSWKQVFFFVFMLNLTGGLRMQQWKFMDVSESHKSWHFTHFVVRNILVAGCLFWYPVIGSPWWGYLPAPTWWQTHQSERGRDQRRSLGTFHFYCQDLRIWVEKCFKYSAWCILIHPRFCYEVFFLSSGKNRPSQNIPFAAEILFQVSSILSTDEL